MIPARGGDTLRFGNAEFDTLLQAHPELQTLNVVDPEQLYASRTHGSAFGSEVGQDHYYILYGHALNQRNGVRFEELRVRLDSLFTTVNALFQRLRGGGTFYGHQHARIPCLVEYDIARFGKDAEMTEPFTGASEAKTLYIRSLHAIVVDEIGSDQSLTEYERTMRTNELNLVVGDIAALIPNKRHLHAVQRFHHRYYTW